MAESKMIIMQTYAKGDLNLNNAILKLSSEKNYSALIILTLGNTSDQRNEILNFILEKKSLTVVFSCESLEHFNLIIKSLEFLKEPENNGRLRWLIICEGDKSERNRRVISLGSNSQRGYLSDANSVSPPPRPRKPIPDIKENQEFNDNMSILSGATNSFRENKFNSPVMVYAVRGLFSPSSEIYLQLKKMNFLILDDKSNIERIKYWSIFATVVSIATEEGDKEIIETWESNGITVIHANNINEAKEFLVENPILVFSDYIRILATVRADNDNSQSQKESQITTSTCASVAKTIRAISVKYDNIENYFKGPMLFYCKPSVSSVVDTEIYKYSRTWAADQKKQFVDYGLMKPLIWAPNILSDGTADSSWSGTFTVYDASARGLSSKDKKKRNEKEKKDLKNDKEKKKEKKESFYIQLLQNSQLIKVSMPSECVGGNPTWDGLLWHCNATVKDTVTFEVNRGKSASLKLTKNSTKNKSLTPEKKLSNKASISSAEKKKRKNSYAFNSTTGSFKEKKKKDALGVITFKLEDILGEVSHSCPSVAKVWPIQIEDKSGNHKKAIIRVTIGLAACQGMGHAKQHFGYPFQVSLQNAKKAGQQHFTTKVLKVLMKNGGDAEGLFRIPGNKNAIHRIKDQIDSGLDLVFDYEDEYTLIGLLKEFLMLLPESIFPEEIYYMLSGINIYDPEATKTMKQVLEQNMPKPEWEFFQELVKYFLLVISNTNTTKMTADSISTAIGPSLLLSPNIRKDPMGFLVATKVSGPLMSFIINNSKEVCGI